MWEVHPWSSRLAAELIPFRLRAYRRRRRDEASAALWSNDHYDEKAAHVVLRDDAGELLGAVRLLDPSLGWALDAHYPFDYDRTASLEFGRLAVVQHERRGRRVLFDLIDSACDYSASVGKSIIYGLVIVEFADAICRANVPAIVRGGRSSPYGHSTTLIEFDVASLREFYRSVYQEVRHA
jgi:N-acyl-L-homoserine lactone synthetase